MRREIEIYVDGLFEKAPSNGRTRELKEEILANSIDRYNDLIDAGIDKNEAYTSVVGNIGNVENLIFDYNLYNDKEAEERKKSAKITAISVMLYILSPVGIILSDAFGWVEEFAIVIFFVIVAIATGMLVYNNMSKIKKYDREDESIVEEIKEKKTVRYQKNRVRKATSSAVWAIVISAYFIISFLTNAWYVTWVVFIIGYAVDQIISAFIELKEEKDYV
ncbi:permease prefix domain 1-containing protein [Metaclostridioides mangenotii]|uniref:permease prefix domain 1-containing protein n=1 Tax=Metaclostridioides mangenotii TaxID=1540 RepID=UPI0004635ACA|nr:permease prefix domain 1-containing protein [Clostridioides mangenotii]